MRERPSESPAFRELVRFAPGSPYADLAEADGNGHGAPAWAPLDPLDEHPRPPFPVEALPPWLGAWVLAQAEALQVPADLPAVLALGVLSTALAGRVEVAPTAGWREPVNLYVVVVLPPGERKSAALSAAAAPLEAWEKARAVALRPELAALASRRRVLEGALKTAETQASKAKTEDERTVAQAEADELAVDLASLPPPPSARLLADDVTPEKLVSLLVEHGGRIAVLSAEGGIFDLLAGRYGDKANLDPFLKAHAGDAIRIDRVGRPSEHVDRPALTAVLAVQPDVIRALEAKPGFRGRGLLARFLYARPRSLIGTRRGPLAVAPVPEAVAGAYATGVRALLDVPTARDASGRPAPHVLRLDGAAAREVHELACRLEPKLAPGGLLAHVGDWSAKWAGAVARIAGLLHAAEGAPLQAPLGVETLHRAAAIGAYFQAHAVATFGEMTSGTPGDTVLHLWGWIRRRGQREVARREIQQSLKRRFGSAARLDEALRLLVERGYLRVAPGVVRGTGRPPGPTYEVNPLAQAAG